LAFYLPADGYRTKVERNPNHMTLKKELQYVYGLAVLLFVVGVLSYAAYPKKAPDPPIRLMFSAIAGNVLFDHKTHSADTGYGLSCQDCHHHSEEDEPSVPVCGDCHSPPAEGETVNQTCLECHEAEEVEDTEMIIKRADTFHLRCIGCHQEFEAGPQEGPEHCSSCHAL